MLRKRIFPFRYRGTVPIRVTAEQAHNELLALEFPIIAPESPTAGGHLLQKSRSHGGCDQSGGSRVDPRTPLVHGWRSVILERSSGIIRTMELGSGSEAPALARLRSQRVIGHR
jgi:hypothetical protein